MLLDSAPLLPVFDSHYLTVVTDANLLVVRSGHTSRHAVSQSLDLIERVGGRVTGVVLNDVNLSDYAQKSTTTRIAGGLMKAPRRGRSAPEYNRRNVAGSTPDLSLPTVRNPPEPFLAASSPIPSVKS